MIRSMTSFGRATGNDDDSIITVEMRSVNNRYFDCSVRIPRAWAALEDRIKPYLQSRGVSRGKVDVQITREVRHPGQETAVLNDDAVRAYLSALTRLRDEYGLRDDISVMSVARNPAIFAADAVEEDLERDWQTLLPVLAEAVDRFLAAREAEGARLRDDLSAKVAGLRLLIDRIEAKSAEDVTGYRAKLKERLRAVLADNVVTVDENRILTECAIYADKVAVDEEIVRLRSHFALFDELMNASEPVGRKLDFLLQEMNREVNTTGSKCSDAEIAHLVVDAKNELEKIREQIQNLE